MLVPETAKSAAISPIMRWISRYDGTERSSMSSNTDATFSPKLKSATASTPRKTSSFVLVVTASPAAVAVGCPFLGLVTWSRDRGSGAVWAGAGVDLERNVASRGGFDGTSATSATIPTESLGGVAF